jgi:ABC-type phosphate/phosphonate transport system substrate-binding protein
MPATGHRFLRLFLDHQSQAVGKNSSDIFSPITTPDNAEIALDDLVDNVVQAVVVDGVALERYKQRKPGRFKQIKEIARSNPFPPPLVAYYGKTLDVATRQRLRTALLGASRTKKGERTLTMFRLSGFVSVPFDFDKVVAETRRSYPPPDSRPK